MPSKCKSTTTRNPWTKTKTDDDDNKPQASSAPDRSSLQFTSHTGPVYAVVGILTTDQQEEGSFLTVISGGGDDRACWHRFTFHVERNNNSRIPRIVVARPHGFSEVRGDTQSIVRHQWVRRCHWFVPFANAPTVDKSGRCGPTDVEWLSSPSHGNHLVTTTTATSLQCLQVFVGHESAVTAGGFAMDGKVAVTASSDGAVRGGPVPKTGVTKHSLNLLRVAQQQRD